jgi:hypothetical protein
MVTDGGTLRKAPAAARFLAEHAGAIDAVGILGGPDAVSWRVEAEIALTIRTAIG